MLLAHGCQLHQIFYNRSREAARRVVRAMPRETVEIVLTEVDPYQSGARFLAAVAYPDPSELDHRALFAQALVRWRPLLFGKSTSLRTREI
jgi:hypothetical protein